MITKEQMQSAITEAKTFPQEPYVLHLHPHYAAEWFKALSEPVPAFADDAPLFKGELVEFPVMRLIRD